MGSTELFTFLIQYIIPIVAIVISIFAYRDSRKANKVQMRLNQIEEKLKKYELEEKEKEREESTKACVEARVMKISKGNYQMKVWNSGKATAYNVNFMVPEECKSLIRKNKVPYEFLESGKSFDQLVLACSAIPNKFKVITTWNDKKGNSYSKEQIVTI